MQVGLGLALLASTATAQTFTCGFNSPVTGTLRTGYPDTGTRFWCGMTHTNRWTLDQGGGTPTGGTGPSSGQNSSFPNDNYVHIETSTSVGLTAAPSYMATPSVSIGANGGYVSFYYHMYGRSVQTLSVQSCLAGQNGSACTTLWSRSGQQQGSSGAGWRQATITLPANTNTVQWTGTSVPGQIQGDISVDTIVVAQGPVPPTPAPTSPPPCAAPTAADFFTVTFTNQGTSCAGVGGICYTTSSGSCFTDGPGNYGNNERCSILVRRAGVLAVQGTLGIATGDYFLVSGSNTRRNTARQINGLVVNVGNRITWISSTTTTSTGYVICATALPPCPATPLPTFVVTRSVPSMVSPSCTGGLGGPTTAASTCYTTTSGSCFTDGPGNYGNNERCSITVQRRTGLAVQNGWVVPAGDYFFLTGSATRYTTAASLNSLVLNAGDVINWYSSFTRTGAGYVICAAPAPPPPPPVATINCAFNTPTTGPAANRFWCNFTRTNRFQIDVGGSTPSFNTGPSSGQAGTPTDNYAYLETSGGVAGDVSSLMTPPLSVPASGSILTFYYHMFGATTGNLTVETCVGTTCTLRWTRSGQQQTAAAQAWRAATLTLAAGTTMVRWNATRGRSFTGDISIDTISIHPGSAPPSVAPTASTPCPPPVPGAFFRVSSAAPVQTCTGGGGPMSAAQGTCYTTTSGTCITDGPGNYSNNEFCTITVLRNGFLSVSGPLNLQINRDYFTFTGDGTRRDTFAELQGRVIGAGQNITWRSDATGVGSAFTLCASATSTAPVTAPTRSTPPVPPSNAPTAAPTNQPLTNFSCDFNSPLVGGARVRFWCGMTPTSQWTVDGGGNTPSFNTGPATGQAGTATDNYAHIETSGGGFGTTSILSTPTLGLTGPSYLSFYFHMFGATTGTLQVQLCSGPGSAICNSVFSRRGQQHNSLTAPWTLATISLPANTTQVRWVATRGTSFTGDISIDTITIAPGAVPATAAPTPAPLCGAAVPNAPFTVLAARPVQTCAGGSGPTSATQGTCFTTNGGTCFTDGPGNYNNSESCTISVNTPVVLSVNGTLALQRNLDYFTIGTSTARLDTNAELNGMGLSPGSSIIWRSSATGTAAGYTICAAPSTPLTSFSCGFNNPAAFGPGRFWCGMSRSNQWSVDQGGSTSSFGTGPTMGQGGNATDNYAYIETSGGTSGLASVLATPMLSIGSAGGYVTFYYHMFGATIGNLTVESCFSTGGCAVLWRQSGQQHTSSAAPWTYVGLPIAAGTAWVQWTATRGTSFTGDISIDSITIGQGPLPLTGAPTAAPTLTACAPAAPNAFFSVAAAAPLGTCAGGGGFTSNTQGTCYTTSSGTCVTNGNDFHGNNERCTINILRTGTLTVQGSLALQANQDYFLLSGSAQRLDTTNEVVNRSVFAGQNLTWRSSATTTNQGWTICGTPLPTCSQPAAPNAFFRVSAASRLTCAGGAGPTSSNEAAIYTTSAGTCFTRMASNGTVESATITVLRAGFLNVVNLTLRTNLDYFTLGTNFTRLDTMAELNGLAVSPGQLINWFSRVPTASVAFTICATTTSNPPTPAPVFQPASSLSCDFMTPTTGTTATRWWCGFTPSGLWSIDISGSTPSLNTGPAFGQAGWRDNYAHIEASRTTPTVSLLTSPPLQLTGPSTLTFYYFMYGATIGTLSVQTCTGTGATMTCATAWTLSGQQQTSQYFAPWLQASVSLTAATTYVRFNATRGSSFTGDISIDTIRIFPGANSFAPTNAPTVSPTAPTFAPTAVPTAPTAAPTVPTAAPSAVNTAAPVVGSVSPTAAPIVGTVAPAVAPTAATAAPVVGPTAPTIAPTQGTAAPVVGTVAPTAPTIAPTAATAAPVVGTVAPTAPTTASPTSLAPTTAAPTSSAPTTASPTTPAPTFHPNTPPSVPPTIAPTARPTMQPTFSPTAMPNTLPTTMNPTPLPTVPPTARPTMPPSFFPTMMPTTMMPTNFPTLNPTRPPTVPPTARPTNFPTRPPTLHPTLQPTGSPSSTGASASGGSSGGGSSNLLIIVIIILVVVIVVVGAVVYIKNKNKDQGVALADSNQKRTFDNPLYGDGVAGLAGVTETSTDDDYADPNAEIGYMDTADNSGYMDVPAGDDEDEDY